MAMQFQKASRTAAKLKLAISGPSGSGKTLGALAIARGLVPTGRIAVIDTENNSASLYADKYDFDVLDLGPPFTSARYLEAMRAAVEAGYDVLVIDSLSHQWNGEGGILARKEEADKRPGSNSYTNWATFTKEHTAFLSAVLHLPVHVVVTLRSKQDYVLETNDKGKQQPKKVGMAPVQREGLEYEFSTVFELQMDHRAIASKDRTGLFAEGTVDLLDKKETAGKLVAWLATSKPATAPKPATNASATSDQIGRLRFLLTHECVTEDVRAKVEHRINQGGLTSEIADKWIAQIGAQVEAVLATEQSTDEEEPQTESDELPLGDNLTLPMGKGGPVVDALKPNAGKCPTCFVEGGHRPDCPEATATVGA